MSKDNFRLLMCSLGLPQFNTLKDLSRLTGLSGSLLYCLSHKQELYYHEFEIPKRNGDKRTIHAPSYSMHIVQRWILKNIIEKIEPSRYAMAFRPGSSYGCKANALHHTETYYGVTFDLKNFFPNIGANRVYNVFTSIGYESLPATILTNLCTLDGHLPQGAACSPALSNLVCLSLDSRLGGLCEKRRIRFSRYADDMYFSSDSQDTLKKSVPIIRKIIESEGFSINEEKVHYQTPSNHKRITGITIIRQQDSNSPYQLKASKSLKKQIRAEIFRSICVGDYSRKENILGEIAYVNYIESGFKDKIQQYIDNTAHKLCIFPELANLYNDNLFYKGMPLVQALNVTPPESDFDEYNNLIIRYRNAQLKRKEYLAKIGEEDICLYKECTSFLGQHNDDRE